MNKKIYLITDRGITQSDSVSRYIIDSYKGLTYLGYTPTIFSTHESRISEHNSQQLNTLNIINSLPNINDEAVFHFHLTFSKRKHTEYLVDNIEKLKRKTIVIFHTDTKYAESMDQTEGLNYILPPLISNNVLGYCFSNYSKANFLKHGYKKMFVVYPGLDLDVYKNYSIFNKKDYALFLASNPDNRFIGEIKGQYLSNQISKTVGRDVEIIQKSNIPFDELLKLMAECKYYLALGEYEHYGFSIIDSFNLGCIPIYRNEGGLVEAVHSRGFPIFVENRKIMCSTKIGYDKETVLSNLKYSAETHNIYRHVKIISTLYESLKIC